MIRSLSNVSEATRRSRISRKRVAKLLSNAAVAAASACDSPEMPASGVVATAKTSSLYLLKTPVTVPLPSVTRMASLPTTGTPWTDCTRR